MSKKDKAAETPPDENQEQERLAQENAARLEAERLENERLERERIEAERLERQRIENERLENARIKSERLEKEKSEREEAARLAEEKRLTAERPKRVEIIYENGVLGHKLLRKGDVTDDADYVALLDTERGGTLVREVN